MPNDDLNINWTSNEVPLSPDLRRGISFSSSSDPLSWTASIDPVQIPPDQGSQVRWTNYIHQDIVSLRSLYNEMSFFGTGVAEMLDDPKPTKKSFRSWVQKIEVPFIEKLKETV